MEFTLYNSESAPENSKPLLEKSVKASGMIPNLHGVMAESAQLLEGYQTLQKLFTQTSFNADELTVVWQSINIEHNCHYCVPAHTGIAHSMKVKQDIIDALRNKTPLPSEKLEVLRETTLAMVRNRGVLTDEQLTCFYDVGYGKQQLLEVVLGLSQKIMSNYTSHITKTPVDAVFKKYI